jgi:hypothetical protein
MSGFPVFKSRSPPSPYGIPLKRRSVQGNREVFGPLAPAKLGHSSPESLKPVQPFTKMFEL